MRSRTEHVYATLRDMIIYMALEPGQAIREPEIMDRLHVGRTPVREALIRLSEDMLVQTYPQRGTYVTKIDMDYVAQLMKMRNILETELLAEYAQEKPRLQAQFQNNLAALERAVRSEDIVAYLKADAEFPPGRLSADLEAAAQVPQHSLPSAGSADEPERAGADLGRASTDPCLSGSRGYPGAAADPAAAP